MSQVLCSLMIIFRKRFKGVGNIRMQFEGVRAQFNGIHGAIQDARQVGGVRMKLDNMQSSREVVRVGGSRTDAGGKHCGWSHPGL